MFQRVIKLMSWSTLIKSVIKSITNTELIMNIKKISINNVVHVESTDIRVSLILAKKSQIKIINKTKSDSQILI